MPPAYRIRKTRLQSKAFALKPGQLKSGHIETFVSASDWLHNHRGIAVYLPPGYAAGQGYYPVLYMHDGNNLFDPQLAFGGQPWWVQHVLNRLISLQFLPPLIVVGVYNTLGRNHEYTWTRMRTRWGEEGGQGPQYARYLTQELMPVIQQRYRIMQGPEYTGVLGSSLGGLISFYLGLHYPHVFGQIGMVSPSLWWNRGEALQDAWHYPTGLKLWLDMGTREGARHLRVDRNPNVLNTRRLKQVLQQRGYREGQDLAYLEDRGALHNEWWWGQRLHLPLLFFWGSASARRLILKS